MYEKDGIAYAEDPQKIIQVKSVRPLEAHKLWIRFSTGEEKVFDFIPYLEYKCYQPLKDIELFNSVYVDYGVTVWNDGEIDIAPETLYAGGVQVDNYKSAM